MHIVAAEIVSLQLARGEILHASQSQVGREFKGRIKLLTPARNRTEEVQKRLGNFGWGRPCIRITVARASKPVVSIAPSVWPPPQLAPLPANNFWKIATFVSSSFFLFFYIYIDIFRPSFFVYRIFQKRVLAKCGQFRMLTSMPCIFTEHPLAKIIYPGRVNFERERSRPRTFSSVSPQFLLYARFILFQSVVFVASIKVAS